MSKEIRIPIEEFKKIATEVAKSQTWDPNRGTLIHTEAGRERFLSECTEAFNQRGYVFRTES